MWADRQTDTLITILRTAKYCDVMSMSGQSNNPLLSTTMTVSTTVSFQQLHPAVYTCNVCTASNITASSHICNTTRSDALRMLEMTATTLTNVLVH